VKLINKNNYISIVCISFTCVVCGKLLLEKCLGVTDRFYTENIFTCLLGSVVITWVLSLHYYLQKFPFIPVFIAQYLLVVGFVVFGIRILSVFTDIAPHGYRDMIVSVSIPFVIGGVLYYIAFFREIRKANKKLEELE